MYNLHSQLENWENYFKEVLYFSFERLGQSLELEVSKPAYELKEFNKLHIVVLLYVAFVKNCHFAHAVAKLYVAFVYVILAFGIFLFAQTAHSYCIV